LLWCLSPDTPAALARITSLLALPRSQTGVAAEEQQHSRLKNEEIMTHAKDRAHRMLCNGCSPFDSSSTSMYVNLWTLCPSCSASTEARDSASTSSYRKADFSSRMELR
jgi:hypothetical protein